MSRVRAIVQAALSRGDIGPAWYAVLTGLVMLYLAWVLGSVPMSADPAASVAAVALFLLGAWQLERGVRALGRGPDRL